MKRIAVPVVCATAVLALVGCGGEQASRSQVETGVVSAGAATRTSGGTKVTRHASEGVTHGMAITWKNTGSRRYFIADDVGEWEVAAGTELQHTTLMGKGTGVDGTGTIENRNCYVSGNGLRVDQLIGYEAMNPAVGYPRVSIQYTGDKGGYSEHESRRFWMGGMRITVTREADWHFNARWAWVKHFRISVDAQGEC